MILSFNFKLDPRRSRTLPNILCLGQTHRPLFRASINQFCIWADRKAPLLKGCTLRCGLWAPCWSLLSFALLGPLFLSSALPSCPEKVPSVKERCFELDRAFLHFLSPSNHIYYPVFASQATLELS